MTTLTVRPRKSPPPINPAEFPNPRVNATDRAWDVLHFIEKHPRLWKQSSWGSRIKTRPLLRPWRIDEHFAGCFATLTCLRAGYEVEMLQYIDVETVPHLRTYTDFGPEGRWVHVSIVAADLYGIGLKTAEKLFDCNNTLPDLKKHVRNIFGADTFPAYEL